MIAGISHNANVGAGNEINMQLTASSLLPDIL